jgi:hypothetical protein
LLLQLCSPTNNMLLWKQWKQSCNFYKYNTDWQVLQNYIIIIQCK